ncbi:MAG: CpcT/CpeT family chromophore lyase [Steroidobacteraceae bacterium]|jgi:hypothetical protein|nr:hypothetical protein [Gammaproteobacteria bacterium]
MSAAPSRFSHIWIGVCAILLQFTCLTRAWAQGQDSTPGERNLLVMAELLPGHYDNVNQHYFDGRRGLQESDRHARVATTITAIKAPAFGSHVFLWVNETGTGESAQRSWRVATLAPGPGDDEVTMRHYLHMGSEPVPTDLASWTPDRLQRTPGCDYFFKRRAEHFQGKQRTRACEFDWQGERVYTDNEIALSRDELWVHDHKWTVKEGRRITGVSSAEPYWLERSRPFHCYADMPGVGGGIDIPFERYDDVLLNDKGGTYWFDTREQTSRRLGFSLRRVTWHVLNEANGNFNRNSLVLYVMEKMADGSLKDHGYVFTDPDAERIAVNLKWILVNCAMTRRDAARPVM